LARPLEGGHKRQAVVLVIARVFPVGPDERADTLERPRFASAGVVKREKEFEAYRGSSTESIANLLLIIFPAIGDIEGKGVDMCVLGEVHV
jgi:hypothetical protein